MTRTLLFWIVMLAWLIFGTWPHWHGSETHWGAIGGIGLGFIAVSILGWKVFGKPIKED